MKKIVNFTSYLNEDNTINEEYILHKGDTIKDVKTAVANFNYNEVYHFINSDDFKPFYDDAEMEDIFNGKIKHVPSTNLDKQTAVYQLLHYFRNKNIKEDNLENIFKYVIKIDDLYYGTLLFRGVSLMKPDIKKLPKYEAFLKQWVKYYNLDED
jgi:hypothetical protein